MTVETKAAFARRRGKTPTAIAQWVKAGHLSGKALVGTGRDTRIDVEEAERQLARRLDPGQKLGNGARSTTVKAARAADASALDDGGDLSDPDYGREKARLAKAQADAQEMRNAVARGELVSVDDVARRWSAILSTVRSRMLAVVGRVQRAHPDLAAAASATIDRELRQALKELSDAKSV